MSIGLVVELKAIALIAGLVTQGILRVAKYLIGGVERVLPLTPGGQGKPIDLELYANNRRKTK